jgi:hypothetical protein
MIIVMPSTSSVWSLSVAMSVAWFSSSRRYFCTFGVFEELASDPGSDLMSDVVAQLNSWLGVAHKVSLVDRHESNGVEGTNRILLRHLTALVNEERVKDRWSEPSVLALINFALNDTVSSESGVRPFDAKFGSADAKYFQLPATLQPVQATQEFVKMLDADLRAIRVASKQFQDKLVAERTQREHPPNEYVAGDFVLFEWPKERPRPTKLTAPYLGPYEVLSQSKNDVTCKHLVTGVVKVFHVTSLKIFHGDRQAAYELALRDQDQHVVEKFLAYRGDPLLRTSMEFLVKFAAGDEIWLPFSKDLFDTVPYEQFCRANPPLFPLIFTDRVARQEIGMIKRADITAVQPGDTVYVDLRYYGAGYYAALGLPNADVLTYVVPWKYLTWTSKKHHKRIKAECRLFAEVWNNLNNFFVYCYGSCKQLDVDAMILLDEAFCVQHPTVLPSGSAADLLRRYTTACPSNKH